MTKTDYIMKTNKMIKQLAEELADEIKAEIVVELTTKSENELRDWGRFGIDLIDTLLKAYNRYCEDEKDGIDYLFNLNNKEDLKCIVEGGMTAREIADLYNKSNGEGYFFFDCNHEEPYPIVGFEKLKSVLLSMLEDITKVIVAYPEIKEYKVIWDMFVASNMIYD